MSGWSELERGVDLDQFSLAADPAQVIDPSVGFDSTRNVQESENAPLVGTFADDSLNAFGAAIFPERFHIPLGFWLDFDRVCLKFVNFCHISKIHIIILISFWHGKFN